MSLLSDFKYRVSLIEPSCGTDVGVRLCGLLKWMEEQPLLKVVIENLRNTRTGGELLDRATYQAAPKASNPEEIAAVGLELIDRCRNGSELWSLLMEKGIRQAGTRNTDANINIAIRTYIQPFLEYVARRIPAAPEPVSQAPASVSVPSAIQESLAAFRKDYPDPRKVAFVIMQFGKTAAHEKIEQGIKQALTKHGLTALLARDKDYHEDLFPNIQTFMHGCAFGIAVFERIERDNFNPNVSLEAGYMMGLKKPVLLLKDKTLSALQTDLVGKLYKPFDPQDPVKSIGPELEKWMEDKGFI